MRDLSRGETDKVTRRTTRTQERTIARRNVTMKKPSKTAAELEASIKVEMEDICDWPTDMMISVQPDGDSWKVYVVQEGSGDDADRRQMIEQIAARLKAEYDLKG
jgi:rubrerythrin